MEKTNGFMGGVWFFVLFLYLIAVIGGIGYAIYDGNYIIAAAIAVCAVLAFGKAKEILKKLT